MNRRFGGLLAMVVVAWGCAGCAASGEISPSPAADVGRPAVERILSLFDNHEVVAIAEAHGNAQQAAFVRELVLDPRIAGLVQVIALEMSPRFQALVDRYVAGGDVRDSEVLAAVRNGVFSTAPLDAPTRVALLTSIRQANMRSDSNHQLHVVLADADFDWTTIASAADLGALDREKSMAMRLESAVFERGRKALWIVGGAHLDQSALPSGADGQVPPSGAPMTSGGGPISIPFPDATGDSLPPRSAPMAAGGLLSMRHPGATYVVKLYTGFGARTSELEGRLTKWPNPAILDLAGTWFGSLDAHDQGNGSGPGDVMLGPGGDPVDPLAGRDWADLADGVLFVGRCADLSLAPVDAGATDDAMYARELDRRSQLAFGVKFDAEKATADLQQLYGCR